MDVDQLVESDNGGTRMDLMSYEVLAIVLSRVEQKSIESYQLRLTCPKLKFVLDTLLHHPYRISTQCDMPANFHLYDNLPSIMTFDVAVSLQANALGCGYWQIFEYLQKIFPSMLVNEAIKLMLCTIIEGEQMACFEKLIASDYPYFASESYFLDVLFVAAICGSMSFTEYVIAHAGNEIKNNLDVAIKTAACHGHVHVLQLLIFTRTTGTKYDIYAMFEATKNGHLNIVEFLWSIGTDILANNNRTIQVAAENGHAHIVQFLASKGANGRVNNDEPIRSAITNGHVQVVKFLTSLYIDVSVCETAILAAVKNGHVEMIRHLCSTRPNIIKQLGDNLVCIAAVHGHVDMLDLLQSLGANIKDQGEYLVRYAAAHNDLHIVEYLFYNGINVCNFDDYPLRIAAKNGHLDVVKFLVSVGADIEARNGYAVQMAIQYNHQSIIDFFKSVIDAKMAIKLD